MRFDPVRMVEACYRAVPDDTAWLRGLLECVAPLDKGNGSAAFTFVAQGGKLRVESEATHGVSMRDHGMAMKFWEEADSALIREMYLKPPPVDVMSRRVRRLSSQVVSGMPPTRRTASDMLRAMEATNAIDALGMLAFEPDGRGVIISVPSAERLRISPRTMHQLTRVSAHLLSARRLRARVAPNATPDEEGVEAVLDPAGRLHHAVADAKDARARPNLVEAVRRAERARGRLRRNDPDEALALWRGLVDGRWSLLDHVESDGRRFILARRNEPGVRDPRALAQRERDVLAHAALGHSNKYIAYLLGLAASTVALHLGSAMTKLGLESRRELIQVFGPSARAAEE